MPIFGFNHGKCKTQCRLGVGRIKLLRNKKQLAMKALRKEVAELMRQGKQSNARIRVEAVMREHRMLQAYELLELYLELLAVRAELLTKMKEMPPDMVEAISSLIYAGERISTDLPEVTAVAKMLVAKYTPVYKEHGFPHEVGADTTSRKWQVNDDLVTCLAVSPPLPKEKLAFLEDIASEHGVSFDRDAAALDMLPPEGKSQAAPAYPVETLSAAGAVTAAPAGARQQQQQAPTLAQGWVPSAAAAAEQAPHPAAEAAPGWRPPPAEGVPPPAGAAQPGAPGANLSSFPKFMSGGFVLRRGAPADPAYTQQPSASTEGASDAAAWRPPPPEDFDRRLESVGQHMGAAANYYHNKRHGATAASSPGGSSPGVVDEFIEPQRGELPPLPPQQPAPAQQQQHVAGDGGSAALLPPGTHNSGGSTPSRPGERPLTPGTSYTDARDAADAAKQYSQMAARAAQRAEEFAASQAQAGRQGASGAASAAAGSASSPGEQSGGEDGDDGASGSGGGGGGGGGGLQFVPRSLSEIRRAYEAAVGPPTKPSAAAAAAAGPPSAPPAPPEGDASVGASGVPPAAGADAGDADADADIAGLPSVPSTGQGAPPPVEDELDELTRRFEMLKRR